MTYESFMTNDRIDSLLNAPHTLEGLHMILKTLATTAYIEDKPPQFYQYDLYMLIGMAKERCQVLLESNHATC